MARMNIGLQTTHTLNAQPAIEMLNIARLEVRILRARHAQLMSRQAMDYVTICSTRMFENTSLRYVTFIDIHFPAFQMVLFHSTKLKAGSKRRSGS